MDHEKQTSFKFPPLCTQDGHSGPVAGMLIRKDNAIVTWSDDNSIIIWSPDAKEKKVLTGHNGEVKGVLVRDDGSLVSWSEDSSVRIWSAEGECLAVCSQRNDIIEKVLISNKGKILVISRNTSAKLWSMKGERLAVTAEIYDAELLADGTIITYDLTRNIKLYSPDGLKKTILKGHRDIVDNLQVVSDSTFLSFSHDCDLRMWSKNGKCLAIFNGHEFPVHWAIIIDKNRILSWNRAWKKDNEARLWSFSGKCLAVFKGHNARIEDAVLLDNGDILTISCNSIKQWTERGELITEFNGLNRLSLKKIIKKFNQVIIIPESYKTLFLWKINQGAVPLEGHNLNILGASICKDKSILSWSKDETIRTWDPDGNAVSIWADHTDWINDVQVLSNGSVISVSGDSTVRTWNNSGFPAMIMGNIPRTGSAIDLICDISFFFIHNNKIISSWHLKGEEIEEIKYSGKKGCPKVVPVSLKSSPFEHLEAAMAKNNLADDLFISIGSSKGFNFFKELSDSIKNLISGIKLTRYELFDDVMTNIPNLELNVLELSFSSNIKKIDSLYGLKAKKILIIDCPGLESVSGVSCVVKQILITGCPDLKTVNITGPLGDADVKSF
ncbi:MAG: hypothetical protein MJB14_02785 [Spirochaetes bacterium]|nr:hypothetical protein [Spirochaetota bacterium]